MAAKRKAAKKGAANVGSAALAAKNNPYVQRIVEDDDLRDNVVVAFEAARNAFDRMNNGKAPAKALVEDKKLHKDLKRSAEALKDAATSLREGPQKRRSGGIGKLVLLVVIGAVAALVASEDLRNKLLDALFGAEEEFDYTASAPAPVPASPVS